MDFIQIACINSLRYTSIFTRNCHSSAHTHIGIIKFIIGVGMTRDFTYMYNLWYDRSLPHEFLSAAGNFGHLTFIILTQLIYENRYTCIFPCSTMIPLLNKTKSNRLCASQIELRAMMHVRTSSAWPTDPNSLHGKGQTRERWPTFVQWQCV